MLHALSKKIIEIHIWGTLNLLNMNAYSFGVFGRCLHVAMLKSAAKFLVHADVMEDKIISSCVVVHP